MILLAGTLAALCIAAPPALAGSLYYVDTRAQDTVFDPGVNGDNGIFAQYDSRSGGNAETYGDESAAIVDTGDESPNVTGLTPSFAYAGACYGPPAAGSCFTPYGTPQLAGSDAQSSISANLATGTIKASVLAGGYLSGHAGTSEATTAMLFDTLTFDIPGATASTETLIGISFDLDGTIAGVGPGVYVSTSMNFDGGTIDGSLNALDPIFAFASSGRWVSQTIGCDTSSCFDFEGFLEVTGATPVVPIELDTTFFCGPSGSDGYDGCSEDYSDTAALGLILPSGVTYTSASGVFLTAGAPVPEPASLTLFGCALFGLGLVRHRGRRRPG